MRQTSWRMPAFGCPGEVTIDETVRSVRVDTASALLGLADLLEERAARVREEVRRLREGGPYR